jgi:mitochondrial import receptor subunit TOM22
MVKLEEVADEEFAREQSGPIEGEDDWDTDSGPSISSLFQSAPSWSAVPIRK